MKLYLYFLSILSCVALFVTDVSGQGCVAVRNMASPCGVTFDSMRTSNWQLSANFRYFHSYKHFRGSHEEKERVENGTEVINNDHSLTLGASYRASDRWSFSVIVPLVYIDRSSLYEHKGNNSGERYHTSSRGLGDIRIATYYSAIPQTERGNLTVGLGFKLPTGDYEYTDYFHRPEGLELRPVDQSIQPGDGGFGVTAEVEFSQRIAHSFYGYFTGFYLINPRNTNGTLRSPNLTNGIPLSNEMSVTDQFLTVVGFDQRGQSFWRELGAGVFGQGFVKDALRKRVLGGRPAGLVVVQAGLGVRYEGIPVEDLIGDSDGFRRPGYIISVEPSASYMINHKHSIGVNFPIALYRNRTQSVVDRQRTEITGQYSHGDAAFADWLLSVYYVMNF
ncbi:MAG: hypothetical protein LOY03_03595 [Cyclobacteriaceae bacterium]|nr:hypothetical protein [Cyclobacteriaceae bacterium]